MRQGNVNEDGTLSGGRAELTRIDPTKPFELSIEGRICRIVEGAVLLVDEPGVEYGGQFVDWRIADGVKADTDFWPHYEAERKVSAAGPQTLWQHDHIARRPVRLRNSYVGSTTKVVVFQAAPVRLGTGPLLRYVDDHRACVWVELETPGLVRVRFRRSDDQNRCAASW